LLIYYSTALGGERNVAAQNRFAESRLKGKEI